MYCKYVEMHGDEENQQKYQLDEGIQFLQQWIDDHHGEKDIYFDCIEQVDDDDQELMEIFPKYQPWISEIRLSVHRKTNLFRRFFNCCHRPKRSSLENLAEEFIRIYNGKFNYPIGFRFHLSYGKEKWLLILKNITVINYPIDPYPPTRIIFLYKDYSFIAR